MKIVLKMLLQSLSRNSNIHIILVMLIYVALETQAKGLLYSIYQLEQMSRNHYNQMKNENNNGPDGDPSSNSPATQYPTKDLICRTFSRHQRDLCHQHFRLMDSVLSGFLLGLTECRYQFAAHVWNCNGHNVTLAPSFDDSDDTNRRRRRRQGQNRRPNFRMNNDAPVNKKNSLNILENKINNKPKKKRRKKKTYLDKLLTRATPESAYLLSVISAGVAHQVTKACSKGVHHSCGCDRTIHDTPESANFKWSGCSHNIHFGSAFTRKFLDISEKSRLQRRPEKALTNLHNNHVGRLAVVAKMGKKCKCHGVSGSCEMQTCIRALPDFRLVGSLLKQRFHRAMMVHFVNTRLILRYSINSDKTFSNSDLIYLKKSPNFCKHNPRVGSLGTHGRKCIEESMLNSNKNQKESKSFNYGNLNPKLLYKNQLPTMSDSSYSSATQSSYSSPPSSINNNDPFNPFSTLIEPKASAGSCNDLCCGRGYSRRTYVRTEQCHCKFQWCCNVKCDVCEKEVVESICN